MFVAVRGIETLGPDFKFPSCPKMYNIFHPHDPIAYRVEPLIDPRMASIPPVLMPHHKGRKRFHREIQETVSKFTADIKQKFWDGLKTTISAVQSYTPISRIPAISNFVGSMEPTQKVDDPIQVCYSIVVFPFLTLELLPLLAYWIYQESNKCSILFFVLLISPAKIKDMIKLYSLIVIASCM